MADESFEKEIESVQEKLASLTIQIEAFEIVSQAVIKSDHNSILMELHQSVDSVERTILFLETSKKKSAGLIEAPSRVPGAWHDDEAADGSVSGHVSDMHRNFSSLRRSARSALERVEGIKEECDDSDVLLDAIRTELESLTTRVKRSLKTAKSMLIIKEKEIQELKKTLKNEEEQISAMESKVEDKKDDRNVMRVFRGIAWTAGIVFPPALGVAATLEIAAAAMGSERKDLEKKVNLAKTQKNSLESESKTLERQKGIFEDAAKTTSDLLSRCTKISSSSSKMKTLIETRLTEYHDLILRTDDFGAWSEDLTNQTASMKAIGPSEARLRRSTRKIVRVLLDTDQVEVKAICDRLSRLDI